MPSVVRVQYGAKVHLHVQRRLTMDHLHHPRHHYRRQQQQQQIPGYDWDEQIFLMENHHHHQRVTGCEQNFVVGENPKIESRFRVFEKARLRFDSIEERVVVY